MIRSDIRLHLYPQLILVVALLSAWIIALPCHATTKGLNQIVTPDTQPDGQLSLSAQQQDPNIGNRNELQIELGLTKNFEVAVFQGTSPADQIANAELGLYAKGPYLLSTGFLNWSTKGSAPQPFLEGGYYKGSLELIGGAIEVAGTNSSPSGLTSNYHQTQSVLGAAYRTGSHTLLQLDYQSGSNNFATAGFTYSLTSALNINPAIYVTNSSPRNSYGYVVLTWTIQAFGHSNSSAPTTGQSASPPPNSAPNPQQPSGSTAKGS